MLGEKILKKPLLLIPYILVACLAITNVAKAQPAVLSVVPSTSEVSAPGEIVQIRINITEVTDLWSWKMRITWNASVLNITSMGDMVEGPFHPPSPTLFLGVPWPGEVPELSSTSIAIPKQGATGSGALVIINFTALAPGTTDIRITDLILLDTENNHMPVTGENGTVTVIPEFPTSTILILFLTTTAIIAIIAKISYRRRRGCINVP